MNKHTPGPWRVERLPRRGTSFVRASDGKLVVDCTRCSADAYLISAAPDMYEALMAMIGLFGDCTEDEFHALEDGGEHYRRCSAAIGTARAALSKAEGGGQ